MPQESYSTRNTAASGNDHLRRAREAAEAIFRPNEARAALARSKAPAATAIPEPSSHAARHLPVQTHPLTIEKRRVDNPGTSSDEKPETSLKGLPRSEHNRVRVLTTYGMTAAQVAALYDVTLGTIEKIISRPKSSNS